MSAHSMTASTARLLRLIRFVLVNGRVPWRRRGLHAVLRED
jgi:hypothetical protein